MKKNCIILCIFLGFIHLHSQKVAWQKDISSTTQDFLSGLAVTIDGHYLVSGSSIQSGQSVAVGGKQNNGYDYHILKLNPQGDKVWEKYFSGNRHDYLAATAATQEGGFLLAGTSYSTVGLNKKEKSFGGSDIWIIKINENGDEEWQKTIGTRYGEEARAVTQTTDLGYVIAGSTNHPKTGYGSKDVLVVKQDKTGKVINQLILGGKGLDEVEKVIPTKDGGVLLGIYSRSGNNESIVKTKINSKDLSLSNTKNTNPPSSHPPSSSSHPPTESYDISFYPKSSANYGEGDYWIVKLDKNGNVQWEKNYGGSEDDHIRTLSLTDKGYLIGGESRSAVSGNKKAKQDEDTDLWLVSLDEEGNEEWQASYNFKKRDMLMSVNTIRNLSFETKGFLLGGYTQSEGRAQRNDETFWMLYIDKEGKEVWRKHVEGKSRQKEERLVSAILSRDGSYVVAGTSAEELGGENWKIVKLGDKDLDDLIEKQDLRIYPNPVEDYCYVEIGFPLQQNEEAEIFVHDMSGRQLQMLKTKNRITKINTSMFPQGVYVVSAYIQQLNKKLSTKIVKK